jgi:excisionase family DNA binding protein
VARTIGNGSNAGKLKAGCNEDTGGKDCQCSIGDQLLTIREAAEVLRLSTRTVREYVKRGEIMGKIIRKRWRFRRADLDAFFENAPSEWDFFGKRSHGD